MDEKLVISGEQNAFYKSKGSWDSGPYPKWKVTYISCWYFWYHGWLREGGENLQVPTLVLACLRTVPVAAVSPWHACFTQDPEVRQAVLEHHCPKHCDSLSLEEKMWFTLSCFQGEREDSLSMSSPSWGECLHTTNIEGWMMLSLKYLTSPFIWQEVLTGMLFLKAPKFLNF